MLNVIIGPPCAGKSTYVREHAKPGDVIIDFDAIATALGAERHDARDAVKEAAFKARSAVIAYCVENAEKVDAWIIHTKPTEKQIADYEDAGADFTVIDEPLEVCLERAEADGRPQRSIDAIHEYFEKGDLMKHTKAANEAARTDGGIVKGYAATFGREPDSCGDVIAKGAFATRSTTSARSRSRRRTTTASTWRRSSTPRTRPRNTSASSSRRGGSTSSASPSPSTRSARSSLMTGARRTSSRSSTSTR